MTVFERRVLDFKKDLILSALLEANFNKLKACRLMGIHRNTLDRYLVQFGLPLNKYMLIKHIGA